MLSGALDQRPSVEHCRGSFRLPHPGHRNTVEPVPASCQRLADPRTRPLATTKSVSFENYWRDEPARETVGSR